MWDSFKRGFGAAGEHCTGPSEVLLQDGGYVYVAWCKQTDVQVEEFESLCESETGRPE